MNYAIAATYGAGGFHAVVIDRALQSGRRVRQAGPFELRVAALEWAIRELRQVEVLAVLELPDSAVHPDDELPSVAPPEWVSTAALPELVRCGRAAGVHAEAARRELVRRLENLEADCFLQARFEGAPVELARRYALETVGRTPEEVAARVLAGALDDPGLAAVGRVRAWLDANAVEYRG